MIQDFSRASIPEASCGLALRIIWDVDADRSYDVRKGPVSGASAGAGLRSDKSLVAIRTKGGRGRVYLERGGVLEIPARTLFITGLGRIRRYHTAEDRWRFWWFEFALGGVAPFPLDRVMDIPDSDRDEADMSEMFMDLRREPPLYRGAASALFAAALYRWLAAWEGKRRTTPHRESILRVIDEMHGRLSPPWTVHEMAAFTHLSERRFRQVFFGETGRKPKQFYDELRLSMAGEFLRQGLYSVGEVAARLGFSSPFHFSKAFKRQFGHSPSKVR